MGGGTRCGWCATLQKADTRIRYMPCPGVTPDDEAAALAIVYRSLLAQEAPMSRSGQQTKERTEHRIGKEVADQPKEGAHHGTEENRPQPTERRTHDA